MNDELELKLELDTPFRIGGRLFRLSDWTLHYETGSHVTATLTARPFFTDRNSVWRLV